MNDPFDRPKLRVALRFFAGLGALVVTVGVSAVLTHFVEVANTSLHIPHTAQDVLASSIHIFTIAGCLLAASLTISLSENLIFRLIRALLLTLIFQAIVLVPLILLSL